MLSQDTIADLNPFFINFFLLWHLQGREKEAQAIYNMVLKTKPSDIALVAVASNNLMAINKDQV